MTINHIDELSLQLLDLLPRLTRVFSQELTPELAQLPTTPGQLSMLRHLVETGACQMSDLAASLGVTPPAATAMVKRLLKLGLIERGNPKDNLKVVEVRAAERAFQLVAMVFRSRTAEMKQRLLRLSHEELDLLEKAMSVLSRLASSEFDKNGANTDNVKPLFR